MNIIKKLIPFFVVTVVSFAVILFGKYNDSSYNNVSAVVTDKTIIIDAGHGGVDGGAVASDGTEEKNLNLDIALKMNEYLSNLGYRTILTRNGDYSIHDEDADTIRKKKVTDLHNRLELVEETPDAVLISVHQNYFQESKYSGTQVFYSPNNNRSEVLAEVIQKSVVEELQPENSRQIKKCDKSIFLLYNTTVPAVLVECGFLSNYEETEKLKNEKYRQQMAEAVCKGIIKYLNSCSEDMSATE